MSNRHQWTDEEDQALCEIVDALNKIRDQYRYQKDFWAAVSGAMAHKSSLIVSGNACRHRWQGLQPKDKWEEVAEMAEVYERELLDDLYDEIRTNRELAETLCVEVGQLKDSAKQLWTHLRGKSVELFSKLDWLGDQVDWLVKEFGWGQKDATEDDYTGDEK
jgi:hypothetical protein